jgi:hypothetical protein
MYTVFTLRNKQIMRKERKYALLQCVGNKIKKKTKTTKSTTGIE